MSRADAILSRFPAHLEAGQPGKLLGVIAGAQARDLDVAASEMAAIRRAHRIGEADELADVMRLAALHRITAAEMEVLALRFARARADLAEVDGGAPLPDRRAAAERLLESFGLDAEAPRLAAFLDEGQDPATLDGPDGETALTRLSAAAHRALRRASRVDLARARVLAICRRHARGNGTVAALIEGAANALDLDVGPIQHSADRYLHAAIATDRLRLDGPAAPLPPAEEVIGLIENPQRRETTDATFRHHGETFEVKRRGFERVRLAVQIFGEDERTHRPIVVNRDEGRGIGYMGQVPAGSVLEIDEDGRARLDGADVTATAFAFQGAVFADAETPHPRDFRFGAPDCTFAVSEPAGALRRGFAYPHAGQPLGVPGIGVGVTRYAAFCGLAHFGSRADPDGPAVTAVPTAFAGTFDRTVFAPGADEAPPDFAAIAFSWLERRAYTVQVVIPARFRALDPDTDGAAVLRHVARALDRFRAAGIVVEMRFLDDRFVVGEAVLSGGAALDPVDTLKGGTVLWDSPAPA
jgi:hypothetical protein